MSRRIVLDRVVRRNGVVLESTKEKPVKKKATVKKVAKKRATKN